MKTVAIIPLRAGSKGIINKNKKRLLGRPLYLWVLTEAIFSKLDEIYVFTDDDDILSYINENFSWTEKVKAVQRSEESATDSASTEMAMLELAEKLNYSFDVYCLLQATSPLTTRRDINRSLEMVLSGKFDSSLTVVRDKRFFWNEDGSSENYDYQKRPRRQEFEGTLVENGAVYACTKDNFISSKNRLGGTIGIVEMEADTLVEIDEAVDFILIEQLLKNRIRKSLQGFNEIKCLCLDVDGVFTDATVDYNMEGEFSKTFSFRDGMGIALLIESGLSVIVMTSESSEIVKNRMDKLGIRNAYLGVKDKYSFLESVLDSKAYRRNEIAYIGDDINDLANMISSGLALAPADAEAVVKAHADFVLSNNGGSRVIREACDFLMKFNDRFKK